MARAFLFVALLVAIAVTGLIIASALRATTEWVQGKEENQMPQTFKRISYIVLVILMIGVTSGMLGAS
ncbi:hypothetical protein [Loktanella sp. S4079]|uniref:hypothetical protein n=1 Tax=Loktanella sp. S4079 TaxID=579483 RepID=UPI0005FA85E4|nr:hypothetical protein [Loktanella sp. S4079]KJZ19697.1 hypothetical protein TW80_02005 [Loktanella sp. S4079]